MSARKNFEKEIRPETGQGGLTGLILYGNCSGYCTFVHTNIPVVTVYLYIQSPSVYKKRATSLAILNYHLVLG